MQEGGKQMRRQSSVKSWDSTHCTYSWSTSFKTSRRVGRAMSFIGARPSLAKNSLASKKTLMASQSPPPPLLLEIKHPMPAKYMTYMATK